MPPTDPDSADVNDEDWFRRVDDIAKDRLRGIPKIAEFMNESPRRIAYLVECGILPVGREGTHVVASKARLRAYHRKITGGETP